MKIKSNADLLKFVKDFYTSNATALNGFIDKLPEALRPDFQALRDSLNKQLEALPPLDQVPAATEANWALSTFGEAVVRMNEYAVSLWERITSMQKDLAAKALALNGLEEKVTKGDYLTKERAKELADIARSEGVASVLPEVVSTRKSALELAGLPVPSDDVLGLPAADYANRLKTAKDNIVKLGEKGLKIGGRGESLVKQTAWLGATEFNGQMTVLEDVIGKPTTGTKDPLLGNGGEQTTKNAAPGITLA